MFSHKLFISCSFLCVLYPVVITTCGAPRPFNFVKFGSILSQLNCNPSQSRICNSNWPKPFIGSNLKHVCDGMTIFQGLAILVGYAFSFVVSLICLSVVLLRCRVATNFGLQNSFDEIMQIIIVVLIMFQFSTFPCVRQGPRAMHIKTVVVFPYFEKGLIRSVYTEATCMVRLLLLLSGDVELNPGPPKHHTKEASSLSSGYETGQLAVSNGANQIVSTENKSLPTIEDSVGSPSAHVSTNDTQSSTSPQSAFVSASTSHPVPLQNGRQYATTRQSGSTTIHPATLDDSEPVTSIVRAQTWPDFKPRGLTNKVDFKPRGLTNKVDFNQIIKSTKKHIPLRSYSHPMSISDTQNAATKQPSDLVLPSQSATLLGPEDPYLIRLKSRVKGLLKNVNEWNEENGFQENIESETFTRFYLLVNQLYRAGGECDFCLLCGKLKIGEIDSHIFPRCLLEAFRKIHCEAEGECVFDPSTGKRMGSKSLTLPLFCDSCEKAACTKEELLRNLYITIMAKGDQQIKITDDQVQSLRNILAILMFRGCLTGINFLGEMRNDFNVLMKWLIALRKFILSSEDDVSERLALYLIPNCPFNPNNADPLYILDFVLRCPSFTSLIRSNGRTFFYTQFDCFHCVLPFDDVKETVFANDTLLTHAKNCFYIHSPSSDLLLPSSETMKCNFPSLLLQVNSWKILEMEISFLENPQIKRYCRIVTSCFPNRSSFTPVMPNIHWQIGSNKDKDGDIHEFDKAIDDDTQDNYIRIAQKCSPLNSNTDQMIKILKDEKQAAQEQEKHYQSLYNQTKHQLTQTNQKVVELKKQKTELKTEVFELKRQLKKSEASTEEGNREHQHQHQPTFGVVPQVPMGIMASTSIGMLNSCMSTGVHFLYPFVYPTCTSTLHGQLLFISHKTT